MANHKSAKKRSRQSLKRNQLNKPILSKVKSSISTFHALLVKKDTEALTKSWAILNSTLVKAPRKPAKCDPPSLCAILLVKHKVFS